MRQMLLECWRTERRHEFGQVTVLQQASSPAKHERYHMPRVEPAQRTITANEAAPPRALS